MKNHKQCLIVVAALVISACSIVGDNDTSVGEKGAKSITMASGKVVDSDKVTCKTYKKVGSRLGSKHCLTNREWKLKSERAKETTESIQRQSKQVGDVNSGG